MCGILGAISNKRFDVEKALNYLSHRGPDNSSYYKDRNLILGHTRLSINDLSIEANQPFEDENVVVVFNGEIYNYLELKKDLKYNFRTNCEAEVICKLYTKHGKSFVNKLDGMFAIALYDKVQGVLYCYRDRLGKKPFFYYLDEKTQEFYFASEQKVFPSFGIELQFDTRILDNILNFTFYKKESIYSNIKSLEPSQMLSIGLSDFKITKEKYFELSDLIDENYYKELSSRNCEQILDELLDKSVKKRLISDVPVGIIGSGGIDSSLIAHYVNRYDKYNLLHINSVDSSELKYANVLAKDLNVDVVYKDLDYEVFKKDLDSTLFYWEYPLVHTNAVGILNVSRLAQENGYKVLLGGEGADELFGGYPYHQLYYKSLLLDKYSKLLPTKFLQALLYVRGDTKTANIEPTIEHVYNNERFAKYEAKYNFIKDKTERKMLTYLATELEEYLVPLLSRADRMSMSHGVEMRLPFLDMDIIKFAMNLPLNKKMSLKKSKIILRNIGSSILSKELLTRPKIGFTVDYAKRYIEEKKIDSLNNLDAYIDSKIVIEHLKKANQYHKLMRLYSLDKILGGVN
ncbi:asparagine synthase (glutamine-hydrolyzing) [Aliarcobacter butzleri]